MLRRAEQSSSTSKKTMVPTAGLEPAQVAPLAPQTSASTNFATSACLWPDGQKSSWAAPKTIHGLRPTFPGVRQGEPRKLAALRAGKKNALTAITSEAADSRVPAALPARSLAVARA